MRQTSRIRGNPGESFLFLAVGAPRFIDEKDMPNHVPKQVEVFVNHDTLDGSYVCPRCHATIHFKLLELSPWYVCHNCRRNILELDGDNT